MKDKARIFAYSFLFIFIIVSLVFRNHATQIYENLGNYYYKKNDTQKAQEFYERAFLLGNESSSLRNNYVNSIINSPLTIEAQEKLVAIINGEKDIKDSAYYDARYFLYNLKREIHNKYPENYILQASYNQKIMHWGKMPITYSIKNPYLATDDVLRSVVDAFNEWERVSSGRIKFSQVKINPNIWVEFINEDFLSPKEDKKYIIAYTTPITSQNTLENMVIKINLKNLEGGLFTPNQIYNTSLHEIFHALGFMGHSYEKNDVMYMSQNKDLTVDDKRLYLTSADKSTLELLYKIKPDITNADELKYNYVPYLVLGGDEDINYTKMREAKNYIKRAPSLPNGYIDLADALAAQKRYKEASDCLEKALRITKNKDSIYIIYYNLAVINFYQNSYNIAVDYIKSAMQIKNSEELHFILAEIYLKQEEYEKSIKEYSYLIEKNPAKIDYSINLANIYIKKHKYLAARKVLKQFITKNPKERNNPKLSTYKNLFL